MGLRYLSEKNVAMKASQNIESIMRLRFSVSEKSTVKYITIIPTITDSKICVIVVSGFATFIYCI